PVGQYTGHTQEVNCLSISGDGKFVLSGSRDRKLRYWELTTGKELAVFSEFQNAVKACLINKNGRTAVATDGVTLQQVDLAKRDVTKKRPLTTAQTTSTKSTSSKSPSSRSKTASMPPFFPPDFPASGGMIGMTSGAVAISPDGNILAVAQQNKIRLWNVTATGELPALEDNESTRSI